MVMLVIGLKSFVCVDTGAAYVLTVGVKESSGVGVTSYGSTMTGDTPISEDDIIVYYRKVGRSQCSQLEPLSVPLSGWMLPGQVLCLVLSIITSVLYVTLTILDQFYTTITIIILMNMFMQLIQVIFSYINTTDTCFWCPGISYTRWFLHQDFYTNMLQRTVLRKFFSTSRTAAVTEWFRISGDTAAYSAQNFKSFHFHPKIFLKLLMHYSRKNTPFS